MIETILVLILTHKKVKKIKMIQLKNNLTFSFIIFNENPFLEKNIQRLLIFQTLWHHHVKMGIQDSLPCFASLQRDIQEKFEHRKELREQSAKQNKLGLVQEDILKRILSFVDKNFESITDLA